MPIELTDLEGRKILQFGNPSETEGYAQFLVERVHTDEARRKVGRQLNRHAVQLLPFILWVRLEPVPDPCGCYSGCCRRKLFEVHPETAADFRLHVPHAPPNIGVCETTGRFLE